MKALSRAAERRAVEKNSIDISIGMGLEIAKPAAGGTEDVKRVHAHTTPEAAYSEEGVGKLIADKTADL